MKTNKSSTLFILTLFILSGCQNNSNDWGKDDTYTVSDILYPKNAKLKQISVKNGEEIWNVIADYEYDHSGRISKVSCPMYEDGKINGLFSYSIYTYNAQNQLEKITYYHSNIYAGFLHLKTCIYSYDKNGNKLKEVIEYPQIPQNRADSILYYYDNNRLKREDIYNGGVYNSKLITYIKYEYDNQDNLVKETAYSAENDTPYRVSKHSYQNGVNVKTEIFNYSNDEKIREIKRFYDKNANLIYLKSDELSLFSSATSYVTKYEYH